MGCGKQYPGAWPGVHKSNDCDANCGVGTRSPTRTTVADGICRSWRPLPPKSNDEVLIYTPDSREAFACKFLAQGNYAISRHHCDLKLQPCHVPDVSILQTHSITN